MAELSVGKTILGFGGIDISNQVEQLTHQVDDVTTDQLMTTPYSAKPKSRIC